MTKILKGYVSDAVASYDQKLTNIVYVWSDGMQNITVKTLTKVIEVSLNGDRFHKNKSYFNVKVISAASDRELSVFTVTESELEPLITALIMLKDELSKPANQLD